ncbi:MAG: putative quinol monooxygenase [Desulfococcaceae bacterium]|jgi:quinol monooxygenase YgiN|nr:putative quinol monooxygenase [Desulfococcaceae bacterium]
MEKITVIAIMKAKEGKEEELKQALLPLIEPTCQEVGCIHYNLHQDIQDPGVFVFYEEWQGQKYLEDHLASPHLTALKNRMGELLAEMPDIRVLEKIG